MPLPTAPSPQAWPTRASEHVYASDLNPNVRDAIRFLARTPMFYGFQSSAAQSVPSGTPTNVILDFSTIDNYGGQSDANLKNYTIQPGTGGLWLAVGNVAYNSAATNNFGCDISVNGTVPCQGSRVPSTTGASVSAGTIDLLKVNDGDVIDLVAIQGSGVAVALSNGVIRFPNMYLQRVSNATGTNGLAVPTASSLHTWTTNDQAKAAGGSSAGIGSFTAEIFNPTSFLAFPPFCRAITSSAQVIASGTNVQVTGLSATGYDNYGAFSSNVWTCPVSGLYLVGGAVSFANAAPAGYLLRVQTLLSSVGQTYFMAAVQGQQNTALTGYRLIRFTAGDTCQLQARQDSGGNLNTTSGSGDSRLITLWVGA